MLQKAVTCASVYSLNVFIFFIFMDLRQNNYSQDDWKYY